MILLSCWTELKIPTCRFFSSRTPAVQKVAPAQNPESHGATPVQPGGSTKTEIVHTNVPRVPPVNASSSLSPPQSSSSPPQGSSSPPQTFSVLPDAASRDVQSSANSTSKETSGKSRSTLGWGTLQHFKYHRTSCPTKTQHSPEAPQHSEPTTHLIDDLQDSAPSPDDQTSHSEPSSNDLSPSPHQPSASVCSVTPQDIQLKPAHYSSTANKLVFTGHFW